MTKVLHAALLLSALACSFDSGTGSGATAGLGDTGEAENSGGTTRTTKPGGSDSVDSDESDPTGDDAESETSGPPPTACGNGGICAADVPDGWTGPIVVGRWSSDEPALVCPADWPMAATGGLDLTALPATCGCTCAPTAGVCVVSYTYFGLVACVGQVLAGAADASCNDENLGVSHPSVMATTSAQGSSCAGTIVPTVPATAWGQQVLACQPAEIGSCDDGPCMPAVPSEFGSRYCIMAPGDTPCPAGPYIAKSVAYGGVADTRGCAACECAVTASCDGVLAEYQNGDCSDTPDYVTANGSCQGSPTSGENNFALAYAGNPPNVGCTPNIPAATGSAGPSDPKTFCCTP